MTQDKTEHRLEWERQQAVQKDRQRNYQLRSKYGIDSFSYETMHKAQGGVCAVCGEEERSVGRGGNVRRLAVDHNHATGQVRALLCLRCNSAYGSMGESVSKIENLLAYARKWE